MIALHVASTILLWVGIVVVAVGSLGCAVVADLYDRLHFVAGVTTVGVPLVIISQALDASGWRAALKLVLIAALLFATGPVTVAATARARSRDTRKENV